MTKPRRRCNSFMAGFRQRQDAGAPVPPFPLQPVGGAPSTMAAVPTVAVWRIFTSAWYSGLK